MHELRCVSPSRWPRAIYLRLCDRTTRRLFGRARHYDIGEHVVENRDSERG
jgi:hypothetical protein